jgi:hypothetical protein
MYVISNSTDPIQLIIVTHNLNISHSQSVLITDNQAILYYDLPSYKMFHI